MSKPITRKHRFLYLLNKVKHYRGDSKFTVILYKKFLKTLIESNCWNNPINSTKALFECNTCRTIDFYTQRGWSIDDARDRVTKLQRRTAETIGEEKMRLKIERRRATFDKKTPDEINRINKLKSNCRIPEFYAKKYNTTIEDAARAIKLRHSARSIKASNTIKQNGGMDKSKLTSCYEYWLKCFKGDHSLASRAYSDRQDTRSVSAIMRINSVTREEALKIRDASTKKWLNTLDSKSDEEKRDILLRKTTQFKRYSKSSKRFFEKLLSRVKIPLDMKVYYADNEYHLWDKANKTIYFYDFTIPDLKIMIEYNGILFHPRVRDSIFCNVQQSIDKDNKKQDIAKLYDFELHTIWENTDMHRELDRLVDLINHKLTL